MNSMEAMNTRTGFGRDLTTTVATAVFAGWFWVTVAGAHPQRLFDRVNGFNTHGLVGNWRFFAPNPATHDYHLTYRVPDPAGAPTPWREVNPAYPKKWWHLAINPRRRQQKSLSDIISELSIFTSVSGFPVAERRTVYRLLTEFVAAKVRADHAGGEEPAGFQFAVSRYSGYDHDTEPQNMFVSAFVPLNGNAPAPEAPVPQTDGAAIATEAIAETARQTTV